MAGSIGGLGQALGAAIVLLSWPGLSTVAHAASAPSSVTEDANAKAVKIDAPAFDAP